MHILILDDELYRQKGMLEYFSRHYGSDILQVVAYDANQAISYLEREVFDIICLDHDLGHPTETGMLVVDFIINTDYKTKSIICHSANFPARQSMVGKLKQAGYSPIDAPFFWIRNENIANH